MNLGGPVWHASVMPRTPTTRKELRRMARAVLDGVGDPRLGEWEEMHRAIHVRRRLSNLEMRLVGSVVDVRGTDEAQRRASALGALIELAPADVLAEELGVA